MAKVLGFLHRLEWSNPYTSPPDGKRVLVEVFMLSEDEGCRQTPKEIEEAWEHLRSVRGGPAGLGYSHCIRAITPNAKKLPVETLARIRKQRLRRRMEEKYPLFADQLYEQELNRNMKYYEGQTDPAREELRAAVEADHRKLLDRLGVKG
jgi:hypothetical protein